MKDFLHTSQINNNADGKTFGDVSTIHFPNKYPHSLDILKRSHALITPEPVNYGKVKASGWVE